MQDALQAAQAQHAKVLAEANRKKEELKQKRIQDAIDKEEAKKRRQEEKARKKREKELNDLRNALTAELLDKGETLEGALKQHMANSVGNL